MRTGEEERLMEREKLWKKVRKARTFSVADLMAACALDKSTISLYLRSLEKAGRIGRESEIETPGGPMIVYALLKDSLEPPRLRKDGSVVVQGQGRVQMWRTMRMNKTFSLDFLVMTSSTEEHPVAREEAETYVRYLEKAGYVKNVDRKPRPRAAFRLAKDTGPKPPMIQRVRQVYDPNIKRVVWPLAPDGRATTDEGRKDGGVR